MEPFARVLVSWDPMFRAFIAYKRVPIATIQMVPTVARRKKVVLNTRSLFPDIDTAPCM
jgi:hypothetical protein